MVNGEELYLRPSSKQGLGEQDLATQGSKGNTQEEVTGSVKSMRQGVEQNHARISKTQPLHRTDPESGTGWIGRTPPCGALEPTEVDQNLLQVQL